MTATRHGIRLFTIAFKMVNSFRMQAVNARFFAFPACIKGVRLSYLDYYYFSGKRGHRVCLS